MSHLIKLAFGAGVWAVLQASSCSQMAAENGWTDDDTGPDESALVEPDHGGLIVERTLVEPNDHYRCPDKLQCFTQSHDWNGDGISTTRLCVDRKQAISQNHWPDVQICAE